MSINIRIGATVPGPARSGFIGAIAGGREPGPEQYVQIEIDEGFRDEAFTHVVEQTAATASEAYRKTFSDTNPTEGPF